MLQYSVLMSVYHKEKTEYLAQAVDSMLNQTRPPQEFVLVCDGPLTPEMDGYIEQKAAETEQMKVLRLPENVGLGRALAAGCQVCSNDIIARMDSDDIAVPDRMEKQMAFLECHPEVSALGGQIAEFTGSIEKIVGYRKVPLEAEEVFQCAPSRNPMNHMTVTFRKKDVLEVGGYLDFKLFEDYYLWGRMLAAQKRLMNLPDICVYARVDQNMYRRRGGIGYFKQTVVLQKELHRLKLVTGTQYLMNLGIRFTATVLVPNRLRGFLYTHVLRRKTVGEETTH